ILQKVKSKIEKDLFAKKTIDTSYIIEYETQGLHYKFEFKWKNCEKLQKCLATSNKAEFSKEIAQELEEQISSNTLYCSPETFFGFKTKEFQQFQQKIINIMLGFSN